MIDKKYYVLQLVLSKLVVVRVVNGIYHCICPHHNDKKPSLHVSMGDKGIILDCKAGCNYKDILNEIGMKPEQLFYNYYDKDVRRNKRMSNKQYGYEKNCIDKYPYFRMDTGEQTHIKYRMQGKDFPQGYDKDGEWINTLKDIDTHLSIFCNVSIRDLKKVASQGQRIYYFEGEKDAKTGSKYGLIGFTCGSAQDYKKKKEVFGYVKKAILVIFSDNDDKGIESANSIKTYFEQIGGRAVVIIPPGVSDKGDISDYMENHTKEELYRLIEDAVSNTVTVNCEDDKEQIDLMKFHLVADSGKITGVYHNAIFEYIKSKYNIFVCGSTPYIYDNGYYKVDISGARIKSLIRELIYPQFIKSTTINHIYALFLQDIELEIDFEKINNYPSHWICFQNGMYDTKKKELLPHDPKYRAINQIPYCYLKDAALQGKVMDEYLDFICDEPDSKEMLLQFIGYSLTKDVGQQKFLVLNGEGGTGKSTVIRLIEALIGSRNISNISLTDLQQRFASFGLMGKLLNSCADLEISALEDTSIIKKTLGEDTLRAEQKGKDAISFKSYAKLVFSTNELPLVKSEKTNGFYRRLLVLPMNKVPVNKNPNLFHDLEKELDYLLQLSVQAVERMYEQGIIITSKASERAVLQLRADSDTTEAFLQEICASDESGRIERTELYNEYNKFCEDTDRQSLTKNNFYKSLRVKGYSEIKTGGYRYFKGIMYQKDAPKTALETALDNFETVTEEQISQLPFDL